MYSLKVVLSLPLSPFLPVLLSLFPFEAYREVCAGRFKCLRELKTWALRGFFKSSYICVCPAVSAEIPGYYLALKEPLFRSYVIHGPPVPWVAKENGKFPLSGILSDRVGVWHGLRVKMNRARDRRINLLPVYIVTWDSRTSGSRGVSRRLLFRWSSYANFTEIPR